MAAPGQQFSDWNAIEKGDGGPLAMLAAYGINKSGLEDYLNKNLPEGMSLEGGKFKFGAVPPTQGGVSTAGSDAKRWTGDYDNTPVPPPSMGAPAFAGPAPNPLQTPVQANQQQPLVQSPADYRNSIKDKLNVSSWDDASNGMGIGDKFKQVMGFLG